MYPRMPSQARFVNGLRSVRMPFRGTAAGTAGRPGSGGGRRAPRRQRTGAPDLSLHTGHRFFRGSPGKGPGEQPRPSHHETAESRDGLDHRVLCRAKRGRRRPLLKLFRWKFDRFGKSCLSRRIAAARTPETYFQASGPGRARRRFSLPLSRPMGRPVRTADYCEQVIRFMLNIEIMSAVSQRNTSRYRPTSPACRVAGELRGGGDVCPA